MIQSLALFVCTLQKKASLFERNFRYATALIILDISQIFWYIFFQKQDWLKKIIKYFYYYAIDYYLKKYYFVFQKNLNSNRIHFGDNNKVFISLYTFNARLFFI